MEPGRPSRRPLRALILWLVLLLTVSGVQSSSASARDSELPQIAFATAGDQTLGEGLLTRLAELPPGERAAFAPLLDNLLSGAGPVDARLGPMERGPVRAAREVLSQGSANPRALNDLATEIRKLREAAALAGDVGLAGDQANNQPAADDVSVQSWSWPLRGYSAGDKRAWVLDGVANGYTCRGTCWLSDRITVRVTTNPGATSSRYDWNALYSPNSGNFSSGQMAATALCRDGGNRYQCGSDNWSMPTSGSGSRYIFTSSRRGAYLAHGYQLSFYFRISGSRVADSARTGEAYCRTTDNVCIYN